MHIPNNPQLDSFHHSLNEDKRRLQKEKLRAYHSNLNRTEKEIMDDYNRRVEKMKEVSTVCLLYTSPSPRDQRGSRMPSSA